MSPEELLQLIRTCNLHQVHQQLQKDKENDPVGYAMVAQFYKRATKRKKTP